MTNTKNPQPKPKSKSSKPKPEYPVLFSRGSFIFPGFEQVLEVGRAISVAALTFAAEHNDHRVVVLCQKNIKQNDPQVEDVYQFGVIAKFTIRKKWEDGSFTVSFHAVNRIQVKNLKFNEKNKAFFCKGTIKKSLFVSEQELVNKIEQNKQHIISIKDRLPEELFSQTESAFKGTEIVDALAQFLPFLTPTDRQQILEQLDPSKRLDLIFKVIASQSDNSQVDDKISQKIKNRVDEQQREFYLREKLKAIKDELKEIEGGDTSDIAKYRQRLATEPFPTKIKERILKEIGHYESMHQASSESNVLRNYIDWMMSIPWHERSKEIYNLKFANKILNAHHYGLDKVKERIIEHLAVKSMTKSSTKSQIICFVGPPGVGKTSLAKSIAEATGRVYVKISLGGVRDEAEIRGHRKTYIGSMPGRIIQGMKRAKVINPLFLLDEIDKMDSSFRGDPTSAMLEVLDPEQNANFSDNYIEEEYNLQDVMFIATANYYDNIPEALIDRMEIIHLSSYTEMEKYQIAKRYLIPQVLEQCGLNKNQLTFKQSAINEIIKYYTREAGVRELERCLMAIARKFIVLMLRKEMTHLEVTNKIVNDLLRKRIFEHGTKERRSQIGVVTGLAYTQYGGDILPIEVNYFPGKGNLILTGKLGEIMKESATIALDYIKANARRYKVNSEIFENNDIHIHIPEGAVPKDGPSAGVTMTTAIISALSNRPVSKDIGMTGEMTLRGQILPIGGLKEKSISANRSGLKKILIPFKNQKDLEDIPAEVKKQLDIKFYQNYNDLYREVFQK